jgi:hypothetical protein
MEPDSNKYDQPVNARDYSNLFSRILTRTDISSDQKEQRLRHIIQRPFKRWKHPSRPPPTERLAKQEKEHG